MKKIILAIIALLVLLFAYSIEVKVIERKLAKKYKELPTGGFEEQTKIVIGY